MSIACMHVQACLEVPENTHMRLEGVHKSWQKVSYRPQMRMWFLCRKIWALREEAEDSWHTAARRSSSEAFV